METTATATATATTETSCRQSYPNVHTTDSITGFDEIIQSLWRTHNFDTLYVSLGGKFNEAQLSFNYPQEISRVNYTTNASYQLIPQFLRNRDVPQKTLIIALDDFSSPELLAKNQHIVGATISRQESHMSIVLFNYLGSQIFITKFAKYIVKQMCKWEMDPKKCMICNYIKFMRPNPHEIVFESQIPVLIQEVLNQTENEQYSACFYNWFGYSIYTYNIIYNYKTYIFSLLHSDLFVLLNKTLKNVHLSCMNMQLVQDRLSGVDEYYKKPFFYLLKHSIDITTYCPLDDEIAVTMLAYL